MKNPYFRSLLRPPEWGKGILKIPWRCFIHENADPTQKEWRRGGSAWTIGSITGGQKLPSFIKNKKIGTYEAATTVNWQLVSSLASVAGMWRMLKDCILDLRGRFVPRSSKRTDKGAPLIKWRHRRTRQVKQIAYFFFKLTHYLLKFSVYMVISKRLSKLVALSRRQYESKLTADVRSNPRATYSPRD